MLEPIIKSMKSLRRRLPRLPARFHIASGLSSLTTSVVLLAIVAGIVPDRSAIESSGRIALSEALASSGSILLRRGDVDGLRRSLEFVVARNPDLLSVSLHRSLDKSTVVFGEQPGDAAGGESDASDAAGVIVPLFRGQRAWGELRFRFVDTSRLGWLERARRSPFALMIFLGLVTLPIFYFYLGRVLKQLDPSAAVPNRVRSALDSIAEALLVIDRRGDLVLANSAFAELAGQSSEALLGMSARELAWVHEEGAVASWPWSHALATGESTRHEMVNYDAADGSRRTFIVNSTAINGAGGKVGGVLVSMDDVTLLEEKERLLRASMREAEEANAAKTAFLSNVSHEIRTPMTAILGFTEVLLRGASGGEQERLRHLGTIADSGRHLLGLINDLLDLSKVESGAMDIERIETRPASIAAEVVKVLRVKAEEKKISLEFSIDSDCPEVVEGDPGRLRQVITNLVGNAIKFTESGGVRVGLSWDSADESLCITVRDSGIGMTELQQATVFEAFSQADASITRRFGGTGLGLSISRQLAVAMGGRIELTSSPGKGSTFTLRIPCGDVSAAGLLNPATLMAGLEAMDAVSAGVWHMPPARILVVDDAAENQELLSLVLGDLGLEILLASNGAEALEAATREDPAIVLMDIQMPVMDGYEAARRLRANGYERPVIALSANAMKGSEERAFAAGFSHYETKPIDIDRLSALLGRLVGGTWLESDERTTSNSEGAGADTLKTGPVSGSLSAQGQGSTAEADHRPIASSLAASDERFAAIAERFLDRVATETAEMQVAFDSADFDRLAALAHWLKGSGGTVGYACLREPAAMLEVATRARDRDAIRHAMARIDVLVDRLVVHDDRGVLSIENGGEPATAPGVAAATKSAPGRLLGDHRLENLTGRFMMKLADRLPIFETDSTDPVELAAQAHWLKGSAGNLGFVALSKVAGTLEIAAGSTQVAQAGGGVALAAARSSVVDVARSVIAAQGSRNFPVDLDGAA